MKASSSPCRYFEDVDQGDAHGPALFQGISPRSASWIGLDDHPAALQVALTRPVAAAGLAQAPHELSALAVVPRQRLAMVLAAAGQQLSVSLDRQSAWTVSHDGAMTGDEVVADG